MQHGVAENLHDFNKPSALAATATTATKSIESYTIDMHSNKFECTYTPAQDPSHSIQHLDSNNIVWLRRSSFWFSL